MTREEKQTVVRHMAERMDDDGLHLVAEIVRRYGRLMLDTSVDDDEGCVFPAAAAMPEVGNLPTVRAKA